jgi:hypothetical protein
VSICVNSSRRKGGYLSVMHAGAGQKGRRKRKKEKKATLVIPTTSRTSAIDVFGSRSQSETLGDSSKSSVMPLRQSDTFCAIRRWWIVFFFSPYLSLGPRAPLISL